MLSRHFRVKMLQNITETDAKSCFKIKVTFKKKSKHSCVHLYFFSYTFSSPQQYHFIQRPIQTSTWKLNGTTLPMPMGQTGWLFTGSMEYLYRLPCQRQECWMSSLRFQISSRAILQKGCLVSCVLDIIL